MSNPNEIEEALLVLADGTVFEGEAIGVFPESGIATGEVMFNTVMAGYQEVITDPSYAGQIITFTYPHIGNYGVVDLDNESQKVFCRGIIVRDLARRHSNWRATASLSSLLAKHHLPGIAGLDTRRLTRHIRSAGAMPAAFGTADEQSLKAAVAGVPETLGVDLVSTVTCDKAYTHHSEVPRRIVAYDFGIKSTIVAKLADLGTVEVVPASTTASDVLARKPDGVFLSNGPGDPEPVDYARLAIENLLGQVPIFGICLGHQLMALALGCTTYKLRFGHHGGNHPVRSLLGSANGAGNTSDTSKIAITSQNHNYCVDCAGVKGIEVTHVNLNDDTVEGLRSTEVPAFSVQYHPEASPGPHESAYLFDEFAKMMDEHS
ncbi:MAG: glutamine-hydrolyzing carbamoyl-phosphate synthase small subunit [Acidimicrobiales bacterium]